MAVAVSKHLELNQQSLIKSFRYNKALVLFQPNRRIYFSFNTKSFMCTSIAHQQAVDARSLTAVSLRHQLKSQQNKNASSTLSFF